jgi:hypothetical protein
MINLSDNVPPEDTLHYAIARAIFIVLRIGANTSVDCHFDEHPVIKNLRIKRVIDLKADLNHLTDLAYNALKELPPPCHRTRKEVEDVIFNRTHMGNIINTHSKQHLKRP